MAKQRKFKVKEITKLLEELNHSQGPKAIELIESNYPGPIGPGNCLQWCLSGTVLVCCQTGGGQRAIKTTRRIVIPVSGVSAEAFDEVGNKLKVSETLLTVPDSAKVITFPSKAVKARLSVVGTTGETLSNVEFDVPVPL